jgi:hypothetical protein
MSDRERKQAYWESMGGEGPCPWNPEDYADSTYWRNRDPAQEIPKETPEKRALDVQVGGGHYKDYSIQPVEFVVANNIPFLEACVIKRVCRHRTKNGVEDLNKAIHELKLMKELYYGA